MIGRDDLVCFQRQPLVLDNLVESSRYIWVEVQVLKVLYRSLLFAEDLLQVLQDFSRVELLYKVNKCLAYELLLDSG